MSDTEDDIEIDLSTSSDDGSDSGEGSKSISSEFLEQSDDSDDYSCVESDDTSPKSDKSTAKKPSCAGQRLDLRVLRSEVSDDAHSEASVKRNALLSSSKKRSSLSGRKDVIITTASRSLASKIPHQEEGGGGETEDNNNCADAEEEARRREANIRALMDGSLDVSRKPLLSKILTVKDAEAVLKRAFRSPHPNAPARSSALRKALAARKAFVPWGSGKPFQPVKVTLPAQQEDDRTNGLATKETVETVELPQGIEPLIVWEPPEGTAGDPVRVDDALTRFLRPHQREGVQFMFECVAGLRNYDGCGCILADDMGLGKTLQGITLLWTLLNRGHELLGGNPIAHRVIICCPTSLVSNWDSECTKWLNGRVRTLPLCESSREDVIATIDQFLSPRRPAQVLIVSYETFRLHADRFAGENACDLLICDEAHRLKNDQTLTNKALDSLTCRRRVLLSGTPMQNQLQEFYSMVNFCNPGILGTPSQFRRYFEAPILSGREPDASDAARELGESRSTELSNIVNEFILRRTNNLLSEHLPPKVVEVVCCRMTPLQYALYCHFVQSRSVRSLFASQRSARVLSAITSLRKLLNHPKLIYDMVYGKPAKGNAEGSVDGFSDARDVFPAGIFESGRGMRGQLPLGWENYSGKFAVVARMLALLRSQTKDRVVLVSNFTQTLDLFSALCRERGYPCLRLDGSTSIAKRQKLVKRFNDPNDNQFLFLLSSKAGGCGLNLVGGNRLILFDMSWNPADDKQAAARVWRDGQRRRVYVYRLMTTGTIEEKVYQRQLSKEGLQAVVDGNRSKAGSNGALMSIEELRDLFSYDPETLSSTYDHLVAGRGRRIAVKNASKAKNTKTGRRADSAESDSDSESLEEDDTVSECSSSSSSDNNDEEEDQATHNSPLTSAEMVSHRGMILKQQEGKPKEEDLASWGHHSDATTVPDEVMKLSGGDDVTFVFSCQVDGRDVPEDPPLVPREASDHAQQQIRSTAKGDVRATKPTVPVTSRATSTLTERMENVVSLARHGSRQALLPSKHVDPPEPEHLRSQRPIVSNDMETSSRSAPTNFEAATKPQKHLSAKSTPARPVLIDTRNNPTTRKIASTSDAPVPAGPGSLMGEAGLSSERRSVGAERKSTLGSKRRSAAAGAQSAAGEGGVSEKKRMTIVYDSDEDFL